MQSVSEAYKKAIKQIPRNRGYIRATIGIINQEAQNSASVNVNQYNSTYFSSADHLFDGVGVSKVYATAEQNFSKTDGSMYFLPSEDSGLNYYNNGIVSQAFLGVFYFEFATKQLDIRGLMLNFGHSFPKVFSVEWDNGSKVYENTKDLFISEDVFEGVSWMRITPIEMNDGEVRFRIYEITFGVAKTFTNENVLDYSLQDYVSPISETIPSQDMSLEVDNQDLYYSVDNPDSAFAFLETGQEIKVAFGYDVTGNGDIEWLPENTCFLKTWRADDSKAVFEATDRFDFLTGYYYRGEFRKNKISLYDLAVLVFEDAGITDPNDYYLDPALKNILVKNPIPAVKHTEALQIIANAGRCILYQDRKKRFHMETAYMPELNVSSNGETEYSNTSELLSGLPKESYAIHSNDFSVVDGSLLFMPSNGEYKKSGYVSNSIADSKGIFENENPKITILAESSFAINGLAINFRNVAPKEFVVRTYLNGASVKDTTYVNPSVDFSTNESFETFDKMELEFTVAHPNSRITIDSVILGDVVEYTIERNCDIYGNPIGERKNKVKSIGITRSVYREDNEVKELTYEEITMEGTVLQQTIYFGEASYNLSVSTEDSSVSAKIIDQSNFMAVVEFTKVSGAPLTFNYKINGKQYRVDKFLNKTNYNAHGEEIAWENPLVSASPHATDLRDWLATHFLGDVEYEVSWRGDPRMDAGDMSYLELKNRKTALIRIYENTLNFNGAWSSTIKARKAVV